MKKLVSIALCGLAAAAFTLPAAANDADKVRSGANASVEGGTALGGTGVDAKASSQPRTDGKPDVDKPKRKTRAQRKQEREASSGSSKTY